VVVGYVNVSMMKEGAVAGEWMRGSIGVDDEQENNTDSEEDLWRTGMVGPG
jgi:hypothetical protein